MASIHITAIGKLDATVMEVMQQTPPVGGFFRRSKQAIELADVAVPGNSVIQVARFFIHRRHGSDEFRPQRHLDSPLSKPCCPLAVTSLPRRWPNWRSG